MYRPRTFGNKAVLFEFDNRIDPEIHDQVIALAHELNSRFDTYIAEIIPAYNSLLVHLKQINPEVFIAQTNGIVLEGANHKKPMTWRIPVCYDESLGLDLEEVSAYTKLDISEIIQQHSNTLYRFYFNGFLPGFMYLGGLSSALHCPRKASPRTQIPKGAVGIGGEQTGVYPSNSPGGWNIIGQTPLTLFDLSDESPTPMKPKDLVKFTPIDLNEFEELNAQQLNLAKYNA
ncbi:MAG: 5-oxoprolinase subunit PxpB [Crocinitomicaceae bacterium]|nr:5-oxoprolinase subunit PxpB [Crocinitomicaceae bacterium]